MWIGKACRLTVIFHMLGWYVRVTATELQCLVFILVFLPLFGAVRMLANGVPGDIVALEENPPLVPYRLGLGRGSSHAFLTSHIMRLLHIASHP